MPPGTEILFINKNARSAKLSSSRRSERTKIYSHVQQGPRKHSRAKSPDEAEVAVLPPPSRISEPQQLKYLNIPSRGLDDNFDSMEAPMNSYMQVLREFYSSDDRPRLFPIQKASNTIGSYTLTRAFADPLQRNTVLCVTSAAMYANSGVARHGVATMVFKAKALASLQLQLPLRRRSKAIGFSTIHAVALLLYVECLLGNTEELAAHIAGLRQLIHETDVQLFDSPLPILATLYTSSYLAAAILDVAPELKPFQTANSNQISLAAQMALDNASPGLCSMAHRLFFQHIYFLGPTLYDVALKQRFVMHFRYVCSHGGYDPSPVDLEYIQHLEMSIDYQLTALRADESLTPAQHALRLALFIFPQPLILLAKPSTAICKALTRHLKGWLEQSDTTNLWAPRSDLLLWILFVAAHISFGEVDWPWVLLHLSSLINTMRLQSVEEIEAVLDGFYYHPRVFRVTVEKIWAGQELRQLSCDSAGALDD